MQNQKHNYEYSEMTNWDELWKIGQGHVAFQVLWSAIELDLFSLLSAKGPQSAEQLQTLLNLKPYPLRILLSGLTTLGLLKLDSQNYKNSQAAESYLVKGKPECHIPLLGWQRYIVYPGLTNFVESLKENSNLGLKNFPGSGNTLYERMANNPNLEPMFHKALSNLSSLSNQQMVDTNAFGEIQHLVDLGGGDGTNAILFAKKYPHLKLTVFDHPSVCGLAEKKIAENGLSDRIQVHPGNIFNDAFPEADGFLLCHMATIFSAESNIKLLSKCKSKLKTGGQVFLYNMVTNSDGVGPFSTALASPYFLAIASGEGMLYPIEDYKIWYNKAGFSQVKIIENLPMNHCLFVGI